MANEEGTFVKEEEKEFSRYYKFSKWYVTNRELLKKIGIGVFIAFDSILILFVSWTFLDAYVISYAKEHRAVVEMVAIGQADLHSYTVATAARPLSTDDVTVISLGGGKYDFYTTLVNPNTDWWAEFTYEFNGGVEDEANIRQGFILPSEEKPIVALGVEIGSVPRNVNLDIIDISWHRVDRHLVGNYEDWLRDHFNFEIQNVSWTTETPLETTDTIGRVSFSVINDTAFSYYDPVFYSLLMRGNRIVGINRTTLSSLDSFDEQQVDINWFGTLPSVSRVEIVPEVNIFDLDVYKPLVGESSIDTRTRVFDRRR